MLSFPPKELAAVHEAGHAVVAWMHGQVVREPGLVVDDYGNGHASIRNMVPLARSSLPKGLPKRFDSAVTMYMAGQLAGYAAEWRHIGAAPAPRYRPWMSSDYVNAVDYAAHYWEVDRGSPKVSLEISRSQRKCDELLARAEVWAAIRHLSTRLQITDCVSADEAGALLEEHLGRGWLPTGTRTAQTIGRQPAESNQVCSTDG
jgi:hypothetical protein